MTEQDIPQRDNSNTCTRCDGTGSVVTKREQMGEHINVIHDQCPTCGGVGEVRNDVYDSIDVTNLPKTFTDWKGEDQPVPYPTHGVCIRRSGPVMLFKSTMTSRWFVVYGLQVNSFPREEQAYHDFGMCLMHLDKCLGKF